VSRTLLAAAAILACAAGRPAHGADPACAATPSVTFNVAVVMAEARRAFEDEFRRSVARACEWWGPTFAGPFVVNVENSRGPSMALVPAWRGERGTMLFRAGSVQSGQASVQHEVVHVFAPNANRFLAEGLATYAHERLGGNKSFPNFGEDLHRAAKPLAADADMAALDRVATPDRLQAGLEERECYIVAASFLRFLIERDGMDRFRALYALTPLVPRAREAGAPERWERVYGRPFEALVADWRAALKALR
jgi:hypothetical protein